MPNNNNEKLLDKIFVLFANTLAEKLLSTHFNIQVTESKVRNTHFVAGKKRLSFFDFLI